MENPLFIRSEPLLGSDAVAQLQKMVIAVFGIGGVGGYAVEALARAGVGTLYLIDGDTVSFSNLNRHIIALHSTIGHYKTEAAAARIADINPSCRTYEVNRHILPNDAGELPFLPFISELDAIIDAVDTVSLKVALAKAAEECNIPIIAAMGCGNKLHADFLQFSDIYETAVCPLCKKMRSELKKHGVKKLQVLYSQETPKLKTSPPCSVAWVPAAAGILIAGKLLTTLLAKT